MVANPLVLDWASSKDVDQILAQLKIQLPEITDGEWTDLLDSDVGFAIIKTAAYLYNTTAFFADQNLNEGFIETCTTREAGIRLAKGLGYIPSRATPASVTIQISNTAFAYDLNIPPNSAWTIGGIQFTCPNNIFIPAGQTLTLANLLQGRPYPSTTQATGTSWFKILIPTNSANISVKVNGVEWSPITTWIDPPSRTCYKIYEDQGGQIICFGAGLSTDAPLKGKTIQIDAIVTNGAAGNTEVKGLIAGLVTTVVVRGSQINQSLSAVTTTASLGGQDVESLASIRQNAPGIYSTAGRAVTAADYEKILNNTPGIKDSRVVGGQTVGQLGDVIITACGTDPSNVSQDFLNFVKAAVVTKNVLTVGTIVQAPQIVQTSLAIEAGITGTIFNPTTSAVNTLTSSAGSFIGGFKISESLYVSELMAVLQAIQTVSYTNVVMTLKSTSVSQAGTVSIPLIKNPDLSQVTLSLANGTVLFSGNATSLVTAGVLKFSHNALLIDAPVTISYRPLRIGDTVNVLVQHNQIITLGQVSISVVPV